MAKKLTTYVLAAVLGAGLLASAQALSQEGQEPPGPSPEQMMEIYAKLSEPGPEHARFKDVVGTWHAESKMCDIVIADTAGRSHADANLMDELKKVIRVNKPDLKVLVIDSLTGNDAVEQAKRFHEAVGVDGIILTKIDVNKKGGSILSAAWTIKKPILFLGTGQEYEKLEPFDPKKFVKTLLE